MEKLLPQVDLSHTTMAQPSTIFKTFYMLVGCAIIIYNNGTVVRRLSVQVLPKQCMALVKIKVACRWSIPVPDVIYVAKRHILIALVLRIRRTNKLAIRCFDRLRICTNQHPPQRGSAVPESVWVVSNWLLAFPRVPVTPGTPLTQPFFPCCP